MGRRRRKPSEQSLVKSRRRLGATAVHAEKDHPYDSRRFQPAPPRATLREECPRRPKRARRAPSLRGPVRKRSGREFVVGSEEAVVHLLLLPPESSRGGGKFARSPRKISDSGPGELDFRENGGTHVLKRFGSPGRTRTCNISVNSRGCQNPKCPIWCRLQESERHSSLFSCTQLRTQTDL